MIYVTGDTHGQFKRIKPLCDQMNTSKQDALIIDCEKCICSYFEGDNC